MKRSGKPVFLPWWRRTALLVMAILCVFLLLEYIPRQAPPEKPSLPPETHVSSAAAPQSPAPSATASPSPPHPVLDLFSPDLASLARDQSRAQANSTIEQLFISITMLETCELLTKEEKDQILAAGWLYAIRSQMSDTPQQLTEQFQQLHLQAGETYRLVYESRVTCQDPQLPALRNSLLLWQQAITEHSPSHPK
jgi:hypothetical protein